MSDGPTLVAGIGNVFHGDDGFGVEVARELSTRPLPPGTIVSDVGVRSLHLAYDLLEPFDLLVVADLAPRGGAPGTLYVLEPHDLASPDAATPADPHGMDLHTVFAALRTLGGTLPPVRIVGCEPADVAEGMDLSPPVRAAVPEAARLVREVIERHRLAGSTTHPRFDRDYPGRQEVEQ